MTYVQATFELKIKNLCDCLIEVDARAFPDIMP